VYKVRMEKVARMGLCKAYNRLTPRDGLEYHTASQEQPCVLTTIGWRKRKDFAIFGSTEDIRSLEIMGIIISYRNSRKLDISSSVVNTHS
jgi:hypothetical protein